MDRQKGGMVVFDMSEQRLDLTINKRQLVYVTIYRNKMILINCSVGMQHNNEDKLETTFKRYLPLFRLVGNSFVIQDQYQ